MSPLDPRTPPPAGGSEEGSQSGEISRLLDLWRAGDEAPLGELAPLVYDVMKRQAARFLQGERAGHTLEPTALVHEAFLRLAELDGVDWQNRDHFFAVAAITMRRLLVDHARRRGAGKRGGDAQRVGITVAEGLAERGGGDRWLDVLDVDRALVRLERISARRARVVEMRFFAGLEDQEIARLLGVSVATVEREWRAARAYLTKALSAPAGDAAEESG